MSLDLDDCPEIPEDQKMVLHLAHQLGITVNPYCPMLDVLHEIVARVKRLEWGLNLEP
jgi:hypothetical protein